MEKKESGLAGKLCGCVSSMAISPLSRSGFRKRKTQKGEKRIVEIWGQENLLLRLSYFTFHIKIYLLLRYLYFTLSFIEFGKVWICQFCSLSIYSYPSLPASECIWNSQEAKYFSSSKTWKRNILLKGMWIWYTLLITWGLGSWIIFYSHRC